MAHDDEMQTDDQVSRDAQGLLDEYFRIRREYNSLDRTNPAHAPRRAVLKEQYFALDRKYTDLIRLRAPKSKSAATDAPRSRADVLWEGAFSTEEKLEDGDVN